MKFSFVPRSASGWTRWPTRWREAWGSWTSASRASSPSPPTWRTSPTRSSSIRSLRWYLATFVFMSQSCQKVPPSWAKLAYASLNGLSAWYDHFYTKLIDLKASCSRWCEDLSWWKKNKMTMLLQKMTIKINTVSQLGMQTFSWGSVSCKVIFTCKANLVFFYPDLISVLT